MRVSSRLPTRSPFHLEATARVLQRRPSNLVDVWERDRYLRVLEYGGRQYYASPAAHLIADARLDTLRACGLSSAKARTLRDLARLIGSGKLREEEISRMPTRQALSALTELPGIGPWSAALVPVSCRKASSTRHPRINRSRAAPHCASAATRRIVSKASDSGSESVFAGKQRYAGSRNSGAASTRCRRPASSCSCSIRNGK